MSVLKPQRGITPTILDRLIDPKSGGTSMRPGYSVDQILATVRRDLQDLLNTRQSPEAISPDFVEVSRSVANYGFPDVTAMSAATPIQRQQISRIIESVITSLEPRLREVRVRVVDPKEDEIQTVRFSIEGHLDITPSPHVVFSTVVELATGHTSVARGES